MSAVAGAGGSRSYAGFSSERSAVVADLLRELAIGPAPSGAEKRGAPRKRAERAFAAVLLDEPSQPRVAIVTRDISISGVGFISRRHFRDGERFAIGIEGFGGEGKILVARVAWSRYLSKGMSLMGAAFLQAVKESEASIALRRAVTRGV
ncbi:MAG TPA: PilZ domain-containing protein [Phycisphaerae bacterium]|nr:PilZ domain-containing protein [Phycisphaerae bacterium]